MLNRLLSPIFKLLPSRPLPFVPVRALGSMPVIAHPRATVVHRIAPSFRGGKPWRGDTNQVSS